MQDVSVGIDVAESRRGLDLVALDGDRRIVAARSHLAVVDAAQLVHELEPSMVCIDSPSQWSTSGSSREAERELRTVGINAYRTPAQDRAGPFHDWMRAGFTIYEAIGHDYPRYRGGDVMGTAAEYFPHASAVVLAGRIGPLKDKLAFRRHVLEDHGVATTSLRTQDQVDAALGALTGLIALAGGSSWVGDADEGALLLPCLKPTVRYLRVEGTPLVAGGAGKTSVRSRSQSSLTTMARQTCACGCGAVVRRTFLPGHDAKLRSQLLRKARTGASAQAELKRRNWLL
ncbi:MAG: DUF429 domain-containing protein [Candidatus Dormibacteraeota bacterium]|uniref:DUF429 domain-containing protein n=1 Tax=Candidatus Amunia macphersoniae TaxID=3127014 RepID=A0A934KK28_9BACT|nr:DUF429 domain-containing protein [Candidatus Dormibacteraeota bacterium]